MKRFGSMRRLGFLVTGLCVVVVVGLVVLFIQRLA